jgi:ribosomal protein S18 acetylase RimI-like enzyme
MSCSGLLATDEGAATLSVRAGSPGDEPFFREVYFSLRAEALQLARLTEAARRDQIDREFDSRQATYRLDFPGVCFHVLECGGEPVGRCYLQESLAGCFVVDLILLPAWRGRGLGTQLLRRLIDEAKATRRSLRLHVEKANARAYAFYRRLGFRIVGDLPHHHLLEYQPL